MRRRGWSSFAGAGALSVVTAWTGAAVASSGIDSPDVGVVQMGRGSAWLVRADDPVAVYMNPAAIAFQATSLHLGGQLLVENRCFTREGAGGQPVDPAPNVAGPGTPASAATGTPPPAAVCSAAPPFPVPQLGAVFRVSNELALGFALVTPHAYGSNSWPETLNYTNKFGIASTQASSQRYLLESASSLILYNTFSIAYAPLENLSFGAGFIWGIATADFVNFDQLVATASTPTYTGDTASNDVKAEFKGKDLFVPGVVVSALWSPAKNIDLSAWYHWQGAVNINGDLTLTTNYFTSVGALNPTPCPAPQKAGCNVTSAPGAGSLDLQIPMEAKLGFRFHQPRADPDRVPGWASAPGRKVRDPLSQDVFDVEVDFTWAHNSEVQNLNLAFKPGIPVVGAGGATVPSDANITHNWKDVLGVRVGADYAVVPNVLSLRTGGFFESKGVDDKYLNVDFDLAQKIGVSGGLTVRTGPVDISVAYAHTFFGTLDNGGAGGVYSLAGSNAACSSANAVPTTTNVSPGCYRSYQAVNGGNLKASLNEAGLAGTIHF
jgi:long-subunit fatty acid transport protein